MPGPGGPAKRLALRFQAFSSPGGKETQPNVMRVALARCVMPLRAPIAPRHISGFQPQ